MSRLGLSSEDFAAYRRATNGTTQVYRQVLVLDLNHRLVQDVSHLVIDGQVNISENTQDVVSRDLQVGVLDPNRILGMDTSSPWGGLGGLNRLIRVNMWLFVPELNRWVRSPAFTGRPSMVERDGDMVTIEAQGKECLHLRGVGAYTIKKNANIRNEIVKLLRAGGETRFKFPARHTQRLAAAVAVGGADEKRQPWKVARRLARTMGMQLFYDGAGYANLRRLPSVPSWNIIEEGDDANALDRVKWRADLTTVRNRVVITGKTKASKKVKARSIGRALWAPAGHAFSAQNLRHNGVLWHNTAFYSEPSLHTISQLNRTGLARLNSLLTETVEVTTSIIPIWHLDPNDLLAVYPADGTTFNVRFTEGSIPLGASNSGMTIGYPARVRSPAAGKIRKVAR